MNHSTKSTSSLLQDASAGECLSEEEVLSFASGHLSSRRRRDAHQHFDACEICQRLLNEAVHALGTAATRGSPEQGDVLWNTTFRAGTIVGQRYVIRRFIARGGMGEVFEAFDQELQESVALKTVNATASDDPGAVRRLKAEVQLARRVSHPNVCRIYDFGTHVDARSRAQISFLTMEFVNGTTLGRHVRLGGGIPVEQAVSWARALLRGLSAAHEAGVLHRDFKSDNVMLREEAGILQPLILDFGLARALDQRSQHRSGSQPGLIGTFAYIAPEQLEGRAHSIGSDIYAFGIVWFEMLTGELPFGTASSPAAATLERLTRRAPAPSSKNALVSSELDAIVLGCLERSPADRFGSAGEVLARLDRFEARQRAPRNHGRRSVAVGAAAGLLAAAALSWSLGGRDTSHAAVVAAAAQAVPTTALAPVSVAPPSAAPPVIAASPSATTASPPSGSSVAAALAERGPASRSSAGAVGPLADAPRASRAPRSNVARASLPEARTSEPATPETPSAGPPARAASTTNEPSVAPTHNDWENPFEQPR